MIPLNASDVMRSFVGQSEERQKEIIDILDALAPDVIDAEECEQMAPDRSKAIMSDSGVSRRVTNGWLDWLGRQDRKSIFIGNTNFIRDIDPAFLRAGRINEVIPVFYPDGAAREAIFNVHTSIVRKIPVGEDFDRKILADATWMSSGAEIEQICIDAAQRAFQEDAKYVTMDFFKETIQDHQINVKAREQSLQQVVEDLKNTQRYNQTFLRLALEAFQKGESEENLNRVTGLIGSLEPTANAVAV